MSFTGDDVRHMRRALELAAKGRGAVSPNPMVGAVLVKSGRVIGEGWHRRAGKPHAEIEALRAASEPPGGATLYVNLEPCSHTGRTPPCAPALVEARIARVVAAMEDPNPAVAGRGFNILRDAGIPVDVGVLESEARALNEIFIKHITRKLPFVILKAAISLDGRIATAGGETKWISGEDSRADAHALRAAVDAIAVGVNTVLADDPQLTCRLPDAPKQPLRIVLDSRLRTPPGARLCRLADDGRTMIATIETADRKKADALHTTGAQIIILPQDDDGHVSISHLLETLFAMGVTSLLVEGGAQVNSSFIAARAADRLVLYVAGRIFGGRDAVSFIEGEGFPGIDAAPRLQFMDVERLGNDLKITGRIIYSDSEK